MKTCAICGAALEGGVVVDAECIAKMRAELERVTRERDAAVRDIKPSCGLCDHLENQPYCYAECQQNYDARGNRTYPRFKWRGAGGAECVAALAGSHDGEGKEC